MKTHNRISPDRRLSPSRSRSAGSKPSPGRDMLHNHSAGDDPSGNGPTPICRCRVLYLGSSVPHITKDGLQGIQEPLRELYPDDGALGAKGIDSWLSVWSNGFLLENVDENRKRVTRFFPIDSLHYCAAVRYVQVPGTSGERVQRFLPLDSPFARNPNINHPPLFAAILRRTTGIKVLECHVFICKRETAANALVRCSFHAFADSTYAKHLESGASLYGATVSPSGGGNPANASGMVHNPMTNGTSTFLSPTNGSESAREYQHLVMEMSDDSITSIEQRPTEIMASAGGGLDDSYDKSPTGGPGGLLTNGGSPNSVPMMGGGDAAGPNGNMSNHNENGPDEISVFNGDDNHKVWAGQRDQVDGAAVAAAANNAANASNIYGDYASTMRSFRSSVSGLSTRNRPRQMMMQSPPPPPIPEELVRNSVPNDGTATAERKEKKKKKSKSTSKSRSSLLTTDMIDSASDMGGATAGLNGSVMNDPSGMGRKMSAGSFMGLSPPGGNGGRPYMNGGGAMMGGPPPMRNGGSMPYPGMPPPLMMIPGYGMAPMPPMAAMPPMSGGHQRTKKSGTFSARGNKKSDRNGGGSRALPPFMMPPNGTAVGGGGAGAPMMMMGPPPPHHPQMGHPGMMPPPPHMYAGGMPSPYGASYPMAGGVRPDSRHMEEPIYMPHSARPLSPVASYQPGHFPHDAYYSQQQYATIDKAGKYRSGGGGGGKQHSKANGGMKHNGGGPPQQQPPPPQQQQNASSKRGGGGGPSPPQHHHQSSDSNAEESEFGGGPHAGIYKKGHINERAFAHSMRAEQRSRSYGSLANLPYDEAGSGSVMMMGVAEPGELDAAAAGHHPAAPVGGREMMQMMAELDLDEERIERSEVPANFYPAANGQPGAPNHMYPPVMNGHVPQHHMLPPVNGHARRRRSSKNNNKLAFEIHI